MQKILRILLTILHINKKPHLLPNFAHLKPIPNTPKIASQSPPKNANKRIPLKPLHQNNLLFDLPHLV